MFNKKWCFLHSQKELLNCPFCICKLAITYHMVNEIQQERKFWNIVQCPFKNSCSMFMNSCSMFVACCMKLMRWCVHYYCLINNLRNSAIQSEEIIFILRESNTGHYQITMTSHNDPRMWCHERQVRFLLKCQTRVRTAPRTRAFINLRDDRHSWTDRHSLTGIGRQWVRNKIVFLHKITPKMH